MPACANTEFLLRSLALARGLDGFTGSMANFINAYCLAAKDFDDEEATSEAERLKEFIELVGPRQPQTFMRAGKFSGVLFESFFAAWSRSNEPLFDPDAFAVAVEQVKASTDFADTLQEGSTKPVNIKKRVSLATAALQEIG